MLCHGGWIWGQDREMYARVFGCHREDSSLTALISVCSVRFLRSGGATLSVVRSLESRRLGPVVTGIPHT